MALTWIVNDVFFGKSLQAYKAGGRSLGALVGILMWSVSLAKKLVCRLLIMLCMNFLTSSLECGLMDIPMEGGLFT